MSQSNKVWKSICTHELRPLPPESHLSNTAVCFFFFSHSRLGDQFILAAAEPGGCEELSPDQPPSREGKTPRWKPTKIKTAKKCLDASTPVRTASSGIGGGAGGSHRFGTRKSQANMCKRVKLSTTSRWDCGKSSSAELSLDPEPSRGSRLDCGRRCSSQYSPLRKMISPQAPIGSRRRRRHARPAAHGGPLPSSRSLTNVRLSCTVEICPC